MTTKEETFAARRMNVIALLAQFETKKSFADAVGISSVQLSRLISEPPRANIGGKMAVKIESACNKPEGWLSRNFGKLDEAGYDLEIIIEAIIAMNKAINDKGISVHTMPGDKYKTLLAGIIGPTLQSQACNMLSIDEIFSNAFLDDLH